MTSFDEGDDPVNRIDATTPAVPRRAAGFSLIELVIVMVVMAVLFAIAVPAYDSFVMKSRRAEARELLSSIAQAEGRYYANHAKFATTLDALGIHDDASLNAYYTVAIDENGRGYKLSATPQGAQQTDVCGTLVLDDAGTRKVENASIDAADCWR